MGSYGTSGKTSAGGLEEGAAAGEDVKPVKENVKNEYFPKSIFDKAQTAF